MFFKAIKASARVLIALMVLLAVLLVGLRAFGLQIYTVLSGSMEPVYRTGSLIYVRKVDPHALEEGEVITFRLANGTVATHRIIEVEQSTVAYGCNAYRTQGDANKMPDGAAVEEAQILGSPLFTVPYLGYFAAYIQSPPGVYVALGVSVAIILYVIAVDLIVGDKKGGSKNEKER